MPEADDEIPVEKAKYEETEAGVVLGPREIPFDEKRYGGEFPVDVENKAFGLDEAPADLHMTTTVTGSGTLEVITEGPEGTIGIPTALCEPLGLAPFSCRYNTDIHGRGQHRSGHRNG